MSRFFRAFSVFGFLSGLAVLLYARYIEPFRPRMRHYKVQLTGAHAQLDGLRIAFVSDTHVGPHFAAKDLDPIAESLERIQPDLVVFGGDYISESPRYIDDTVAPLARIARTGRLGAYAVLGNHDVSNSRLRVSAALDKAGITLMVNDAHRFAFGEGEFWIVGADDILLGRPDLKAAFMDVPVDAASIAVWHEPDWADRMALFGPILQLSGHTHGGQIRVPRKRRNRAASPRQAIPRRSLPGRRNDTAGVARDRDLPTPYAIQLSS